MRDGLTRERESSAQGKQSSAYLDRNLAKLVLVNSTAAGEEFTLDRERLILGRGPGVDLAFDDPDMSRQHARIECSKDGPGICDLGSTNGVFVNGEAVQSADLQNGDRIELGGLVFQLVVEQRQHAPEVYELSIES